MSSTIATSGRTRSIAWSRLLLAGLIALVGSIVATGIVYFVASSVSDVFQSYINPDFGRPIGALDVAGATAGGAIGAMIVFALLNLFTRRPVTIFRWTALVVLLLSFSSPFTLPGAPLGLILTLEFMHIVAAAVITYALTTYSRAR